MGVCTKCFLFVFFLLLSYLLLFRFYSAMASVLVYIFLTAKASFVYFICVEKDTLHFYHHCSHSMKSRSKSTKFIHALSNVDLSTRFWFTRFIQFCFRFSSIFFFTRSFRKFVVFICFHSFRTFIYVSSDSE